MRSLSNSLPRDSRRLCILHQNKEIIRNSNSFFQGKAPKEVVPTHPRSLFLHTNPTFVGVGGWAHTDLAFVGGFGLTQIPLISLIFLMVGNLTEVGGHFKAHTDSTFWVGLGSHGFNGFNKDFS